MSEATNMLASAEQEAEAAFPFVIGARRLVS
jgi:hypothetical protein